MSRLWRWLAIFAYRRWATAEGRKPVGVPGNRDPQNPCEAFAPRPRQRGDWGDCQTDGHYLCRECVHRETDEDAADRRPWETE